MQPYFSIVPLAGGYFGAGNATVTLGCKGFESNMYLCNGRITTCQSDNIAAVNCSKGTFNRSALAYTALHATTIQNGFTVCQC